MAPNHIQDAELTSFVQDERFSRTFERPAAPSNKALRVSYADYGYRNETNPELEHVLLFCGPLMGSCLLHVSLDALAREHRVRIIHPDRPGFGETTNVRAQDRLLFFREQTLALLHHLQIKHVSVAAQSGGAVYAVDLLLHHPQLLDPDHPYLAIGAPWVHPSHTDKWALSLASSLPKAIVGQTDKLASLLATVSNPVIEKSINLARPLLGWLGFGLQDADAVDPQVALADALEPKLMKAAFSRPVVGLSDDAVLLIQRPPQNRWADWGDYNELVPRLRDTLRESSRRLLVEVFLSEKDGMIGDAGSKGQEWFKLCWTSEGDDNTIHFLSKQVSGADHDSIWAIRWGVPLDVFTRMSSTSLSGTGCL